MADKAQQSNIFLEPRVSVYARKYGEWAELGDWFETARPWHKHVLYGSTRSSFHACTTSGRR